MTAADDPDPEDDLSPVDWAWIQWMKEVSRECPGVGFSRDRWGQFWGQRGSEPPIGPASTPAALRTLIGTPKPREATP